MRKKYANYFVCPQCNAPLILLKVFSKEADEILDGLCWCEQNHYYPIIEGIPRLLTTKSLFKFVHPSKLNPFFDNHEKDIPKEFLDEVRNQRTKRMDDDISTAALYSYMWRKWGTDFDVYDSRDYQRLTGGYLELNTLENKSVIDVGGGMGRNIQPMLSLGAKEAICMDMGDAIELAYRKYRHNDRVLCIQADIYQPPFENTFDFVLCIGVLQHLPDSSRGFAQLVKLANQHGQIFAWVYGNSSIKNFLMILRKVCNKLPQSWVWNLCAFFATLRWVASKLKVFLPMLGRYEAGYSFHYFRTNTFDHLSAPIIDFFQKDTLEKWLQQSSISEYELIERFPRQANASWIIKARKCAQTT